MASTSVLSTATEEFGSAVVRASVSRVILPHMVLGWFMDAIVTKRLTQ